MIVFALAASAQSVPGVPALPTAGNPPTAAPSVTPPGVTPPTGTSIPGAGQTSNPIDKAKIEAECQIPTNATKPECIELMLKK
jgi:hypothetical protein